MFTNCIKALFVFTIFIGWTSATKFYVATINVKLVDNFYKKSGDFEEIDDSLSTWDEVDTQLARFRGRFQNDWTPGDFKRSTIIVVVKPEHYAYFKDTEGALVSLVVMITEHLWKREKPQFRFLGIIDRRVLLVSDNMLTPGASKDNTLDISRLIFQSLLLKQLYRDSGGPKTLINASQVKGGVLRLLGHGIDRELMFAIDTYFRCELKIAA